MQLNESMQDIINSNSLSIVHLAMPHVQSKNFICMLANLAQLTSLKAIYYSLAVFVVSSLVKYSQFTACIIVGHCLATKVYLGKLPAM